MNWKLNGFSQYLNLKEMSHGKINTINVLLCSIRNYGSINLSFWTLWNTIYHCHNRKFQIKITIEECMKSLLCNTCRRKTHCQMSCFLFDVLLMDLNFEFLLIRSQVEMKFNRLIYSCNERSTCWFWGNIWNILELETNRGWIKNDLFWESIFLIFLTNRLRSKWRSNVFWKRNKKVF